MSKKANLKKLLFIIFVLVLLLVATYIFLHSRGYFRRRYVREFQGVIVSFGPWSPLIVLFLFFLSTAIPPLPLPLPLIELASGLIFGFWEGFFIVWVSQILSSLFAFYIAKLFRKNRFLDKHRNLLSKNGAHTVLISRLTLSAPFNFISYLAGLSQIDLKSFTIATALGTVPESMLYSYVGSLLTTSRFSLWGTFIGVFFLSLFGFTITLTSWGKRIFSK